MSPSKPQRSNGLIRPVPSLKVTSALSLSLISFSDAEELFALVEINRIYLRKTLPWLDTVKTLNDQISYISNCLSEYDRYTGAMYAIRQDGRIIGIIGLNWIDQQNRGCGIGYWISEEYMGGGVITQSCSRMIDHCFSDLGLHRFVLEAAVDNTASCKVAERLGMRLEGVIKDRELLYGSYLDANLYSITGTEWAQK